MPETTPPSRQVEIPHNTLVERGLVGVRHNLLADPTCECDVQRVPCWGCNVYDFEAATREL